MAAYGPRHETAVRAFQQQRGLTVDGIVGPETYRRLHEARWQIGDRVLTHLVNGPVAGDDVFVLQQRLLDLGFRVGKVDGYYGAETAAGVAEFQRNSGLPPDGTCGPATLKALDRLTPRVLGGAPNTMRAEELIREAGPQLVGKVVVIDPGRAHNLPDSQAVPELDRATFANQARGDVFPDADTTTGLMRMSDLRSGMQRHARALRGA